MEKRELLVNKKKMCNLYNITQTEPLNKKKTALPEKGTTYRSTRTNITIQEAKNENKFNPLSANDSA